MQHLNEVQTAATPFFIKLKTCYVEIRMYVVKAALKGGVANTFKTGVPYRKEVRGWPRPTGPL